MRKPRGSVSERFWTKVEKTNTCWLWRGATDRAGYGAISLGGRGVPIARAHRVSWVMANGQSVPEGRLVLHHCDVKICVRPDHLYLGDKRDNAADALARGQMSRGQAHPVPRGSAHWKAKLTDEQVAEIRDRRAKGETLRSLSVAFGVSEAHVSRLAHRLSRI